MLINPKGLFRFSFNQNMGKNLALRSWHVETNRDQDWDFSTRQDKVLKVSRFFSTVEANFYAILFEIFKIETFSTETWLGQDFSRDLNQDFSTVENYLKALLWLRVSMETRLKKIETPSLAGIIFTQLLLCPKFNLTLPNIIQPNLT